MEKSCKKELVLVFIFAGLFCLLSSLVYFCPRLTECDVKIVQGIQGLFSFIPLEVANFVSDFYYKTMYYLWGIVFIYMVAKKDFVSLIFYILFVKLFVLTKEFFKMVIARPRPPIELQLLVHPAGWSYPSGHSLLNMVFFGILAYLIKKHVENVILKNILISLCVLWILFVGLSRILLGVHHLTDVVGGFLLASVAICLFIFVDKNLN